MLIVSDQKVRQLREAVTNWISGIIILRGPNGCGKAFTLSHVCRELGLELYRDPGVGSLADLAGRLNDNSCTVSAVLCQDTPQLLLIHPLIAQFPKVLFVFSIDENNFAYKKIDSYLIINFNALSDLAITKLVTARSPPDTDPVVVNDVVRTARGDARQALLQLEIRGMLVDEDETSKPKVKRKRKGETIGEEGAAESGKDSEFSFFHIIGKVLYNKEGTVQKCDSLCMQPVITDSGEMAIYTLYENIPDFVGDIAALDRILGMVSFVDTASRFDRVGPPDANLFNWLMFKSMTVLNQGNLEGRSAAGFSAFRRPVVRDLDFTRQARKDELTSARSEYRWLDWRALHMIDSVMRDTNGDRPQALPVEMKMRIYNVLHDSKGGGLAIPLIQPRELDEDPLEEC